MSKDAIDVVKEVPSKAKPKTVKKPRSVKSPTKFPIEEFLDNADMFGYTEEMIYASLMSYEIKDEYTKEEFNFAIEKFTKNLK